MSKKYKITVNGTAYEVEVEDIGSSASATGPCSGSSPCAGSCCGSCPHQHRLLPLHLLRGGRRHHRDRPYAGKVLRVVTSVGASVNAGDLLLVLEAMKMENEIQAPSAGTVKEIKVSDGSPLNTGDVLVVIG